MSWRFGLLETMKDPQYIVINTEKLVAIKDKFPKARHHFLVISYEEIDSIFNLNKDHIELVKEMTLLGKNLIETTGMKADKFKVGFHAEPSMNRLHLHIISTDFISPSLKTKSHWNSFNTDFLWHPSKIIHDLEKHGKLRRLSVAECKQLLQVPLKCNSCHFVGKNMPDFKSHLESHVGDT